MLLFVVVCYVLSVLLCVVVLLWLSFGCCSLWLFVVFLLRLSLLLVACCSLFVACCLFVVACCGLLFVDVCWLCFVVCSCLCCLLVVVVCCCRLSRCVVALLFV